MYKGEVPHNDALFLASDMGFENDGVEQKEVSAVANSFFDIVQSMDEFRLDCKSEKEGDEMIKTLIRKLPDVDES